MCDHTARDASDEWVVVVKGLLAAAGIGVVLVMWGGLMSLSESFWTKRVGWCFLGVGVAFVAVYSLGTVVWQLTR